MGRKVAPGSVGVAVVRNLAPSHGDIVMPVNMAPTVTQKLSLRVVGGCSLEGAATRSSSRDDALAHAVGAIVWCSLLQGVLVENPANVGEAPRKVFVNIHVVVQKKLHGGAKRVA